VAHVNGAILSSSEIITLWADAVDGLVRFGTGDVIGNNIQLTWQDPNPLHVQTIGLMSGVSGRNWATAADWTFCAEYDACTSCGGGSIGLLHPSSACASSTSLNPSSNCSKAVDGLISGLPPVQQHCCWHSLSNVAGDWAYWALTATDDFITHVEVHPQICSGCRERTEGTYRFCDTSDCSGSSDPIFSFEFDGTTTASVGVEGYVYILPSPIRGTAFIRFDRVTNPNNQYSTISEIQVYAGSFLYEGPESTTSVENLLDDTDFIFINNKPLPTFEDSVVDGIPVHVSKPSTHSLLVAISPPVTST
jgi:hypothetical protein